jgi:predicted site-specific integrase-resolvase
MMMVIHGVRYQTLRDAAEIFGVSSKTIRSWIKNEIIPEPPIVQQGARRISVFPPDYIEQAKKALEAYVASKGSSRSSH